ncbi:15663_t:CDS:2 [Gigaspora margarita]|uniref:15663_t:CDS:1 n=1 Tax=Gigaspora margarita TaxID=4874 RepID=A0ABN7ULG0_GIGMA|nr:15663_t:CDS:2 [Gigaspora margarita]
MSTHNFYQSSSYNSDTVALSSCTAHTIQLALGDKFNVKEVSNLIYKVKTLNSYVNSKDKYYEKLCQLQAELNSQHQVILIQMLLELDNDLKQNINHQE